MTDTNQFDDYSKYKSTLFDVEKKAKGREKEFLKDRKRACEIGVALPEFEGSHLEAKQCSVFCYIRKRLGTRLLPAAFTVLRHSSPSTGDSISIT